MDILARSAGNLPQSSSSKFKADTEYTAVVILTAADGYVFSSSLKETTIKNNLDMDGIIVRDVEFADDNRTLSFRVIFPQTEADTVKKTDDTDKTTDSGTDTSENKEATSSSDAGNSDASGSSGTAGSCNVSISITVDELDVLSIGKGQSTSITLDAVDGMFSGEVTNVSDTATTSGGVVSYAVDITIAKEASMKVGMSASATITIDQAENIITLPANAIQEKGNKVFVYTEMDSETNELSSEVEIETGLSDGNNVEITSGLSEGDTVYYMVVTANSDSSSDSSSSIEEMMNMGGGERPSDAGSGERPSGGSSSGGGMP